MNIELRLILRNQTFHLLASLAASLAAVYLGQEAKRLNLVDEVISTDEYIDLLLMSNKTCLRLERVKAPQPFESFLNPIEASLQKFKVASMNRISNLLSSFLVLK